MQVTPNTPKKSLRDLEFCTPIGTEGVRHEGGYVLGRWSQLSTFSGFNKRLLVEDFLNWSDSPEEIMHFTRIYGPLDCEAEEGKGFRFSVQGWRGTQQVLRQWWEARSGRADLSTNVGGKELPYQLIFRGGGLRIWSQTLEGYLRLELFTAPAERFRKCKRPGCEAPYFVARHLRQTYCSPGCAKWAQAKWKKEWWGGDKGSEWLAARKKKPKRKPSRRTKQ